MKTFTNLRTLEVYLKKRAATVETALEKYLPEAGGQASALSQAMRYAVLQGGKRIRPILLLEAASLVGAKPKAVLPAACAVELVHSYSLAHDDLPCMDDDATRRGKPSCHAKFGEATALLAGDALLTLAFEVLSHCKSAEAIRLLASAAGSHGMVGGQAVDMELKDKTPDLPALEFMHARKTGCLIAVSLRLGAELGGGTPKQVEALYRYGKALGVLFQVVDDLLDGDGYASLLGVARARQKAQDLRAQAQGQLKMFGAQAATLSAITDFIAERKN